jgi:hypothetical protein
MKSLLIVFFALGISQIKAHNTYFAFAEADWNSSTDRFEVSLTLETHDFEHYLSQKGFSEKSLEKQLTDSITKAKIVDLIKKSFYFIVNTVKADLNCDGYEILKNGQVNFYFSAGNVTQPITIDLTFNLMMDKFKTQQNKFTYLNPAKQSLTFLSSKSKGSIIIKED